MLLLCNKKGVPSHVGRNPYFTFKFMLRECGFRGHPGSPGGGDTAWSGVLTLLDGTEVAETAEKRVEVL